MTKNIKQTSNQVIELALQAKTLADEITNLQNLREYFFFNLGNRKLKNAYLKVRKASVLLMEASFTLQANQDPSFIDIRQDKKKQ